ncbi:hypothetical protein E4O00_07445 [Treponema sp. OMZ 788]|uniref:hypothetical protein n=1 Tax=unclassified Treponema TaxID=2638727 RepID=UPI0020A47293|nr:MULTISPECIES: hypothetical protein [unclassified Treponema]UTC63428.1 hypothetical protein E4O05_05980 [Treponema sp. OMZ 787]UTC63774.1 hypothetical protein E4O00_07445 [Treponema sp. OMZ 788]
MAKKRTGKQTASGIRLLILFLFLFYPSILYAGIEDDIEVSFSSGPLFIDSVFEIKVKLDDYSYRSSDVPKLIILDDDEALEFLDSGINSLYGGILITNKYKLKRIGNFELVPYLTIGNYQTKLKNFSIQVEPPALSKDTMFKWQILDVSSFAPVEKIIQGKKYLIVLKGFFYDYFQGEGRPSGLDINCQAPEASILEDAKIIQELEASKIDNEIIDETGWKTVSYFFWTPLKSGTVSLPMPQISISSDSKTSRKVYIEEQTVNVIKGNLGKEEISGDEKTAYESLSLALDAGKNELGQSKLKNNKNTFEEKKEKASLIAELRKKESGRIFAGKIKSKRLEYEKDLNLKESFSVRSLILKKIFLSLFCILFAVSIYFILYKKKNIGTKIFLILSLILVFALIFLYSRQYERAVYIPLNNDDPHLLYHIPETSGTVVSSLEIGETVIVKQKTAEWFFIEKKDGTGGWQKKCEFIITD